MISDAAESAALHQRARAWIAAYEAGDPDADSAVRWDAFAHALSAYQFGANVHFRKLCERRGVKPADGFARLPPIPTDAFKLTRISCFAEELTTNTFRTSGTTIGDRGAHAFRDVGTYDRGAVAFARKLLFGGMTSPPAVLVFGPSPTAAPDSSLTHMCGLFVEQLGERPRSNRVQDAFFLNDGVFDLARFDERVVHSMVRGEPVVVLGTSFSFVHLLDDLGDTTLPLPAGSKVMQTGGFKGKSREVDGPELRRKIAVLFGIDEASVVSEYGMTELSSQFYDEEVPGHGRLYREPPWARVVPVDPDSLAPLADGEIGIARIEDLLNIDSTCILLTEDRVRRVPGVPGHFELLGRRPGATPRGCSIAIDEIMMPNES